MKKTGFAVVLAAMLALPGVAMAKPTKADTKAASNECHALIEASASKENFSSLTTYKNFGQCVREKAQEEARERRAARRQARAECADVKGKERRSCVRSEKAEVKAKKDAKDQARIDGAETCATEQEDADAFAEAYGTRKSAFRKCVKTQMRAGDDS